MSLLELYKKYHNRVQFLSIYIREAHPVDGWWFGKGLTKIVMRLYSPRAAQDVYDPTTIEERRAVAGQCEQSLHYGVHTYVDEMDDAVNKAYAAWPTRLYLIGTDGHVVYAGKPGPFGYNPSELGEAIEHHLAQMQ